MSSSEKIFFPPYGSYVAVTCQQRVYVRFSFFETYGMKYNIFAKAGSDLFFPSHPCLERERRIFFFFHPTSEFTGALATESTSENGSNECQWRFPEEKGHGWSSSVQPKLFPLAAILRKYTTLSHPLRSCNPRLSKNLPLNPIYIQIPPKIFSPYFRQSTVSLRHYISFTCHWSM